MRPTYELEKNLLKKIAPALSYKGEEYDQWKQTALCCMGNSGGGTATAYFAALEDRIALIEGPEGHRFYPDLAWPVVHKMLNK